MTKVSAYIDPSRIIELRPSLGEASPKTVVHELRSLSLACGEDLTREGGYDYSGFYYLDGVGTFCTDGKRVHVTRSFAKRSVEPPRLLSKKLFELLDFPFFEKISHLETYRASWMQRELVVFQKFAVKSIFLNGAWSHVDRGAGVDVYAHKGITARPRHGTTHKDISPIFIVQRGETVATARNFAIIMPVRT